MWYAMRALWIGRLLALSCLRIAITLVASVMIMSPTPLDARAAAAAQVMRGPSVRRGHVVELSRIGRPAHSRMCMYTALSCRPAHSYGLVACRIQLPRTARTERVIFSQLY